MDQPLDYNQPPPPPKQFPVDVGTIFISAAIAALLIFVPFMIVPRIELVYRDLGTRLPTITAVLIQISRLPPTGWAERVCLLAAVPVAISMPLRKRGRRILRFTLYLLLATTVACLILGLLLPYVTLIDTVSNPTAK